MVRMKSWILNHIEQLFIAMLAIIMPIKPLIIAIGFLIFFDFITGVKKAHKNGEKISSKKMANTINKIIFYNVAIFTGIAINSILGTDLVNAVTIIASGIASVEGYSIIENISAITNSNLRDTIGKIFDRHKDK